MSKKQFIKCMVFINCKAVLFQNTEFFYFASITKIFLIYRCNITSYENESETCDIWPYWKILFKEQSLNAMEIKTLKYQLQLARNKKENGRI